jgi:hypothetical protein
MQFVIRAFAEMTVIVAGVLVALTADSWLQLRKDRAAEVEHLAALSAEFAESREALRAAVQLKETQILFLGQFLNNRVEDLPKDSVEGWVYDGVYMTAGYVPFLSALRDLESSGDLALLEDREIRRSLAALNVAVEQVTHSFDEYMFYHQTVIDPFIAAELPIVTMLATRHGVTIEGYAPPDWSPLETDRSRGLLAFKLGLAGNYISSLRLLEGRFSAAEALLDARLQYLGVR